MNMARKILDRHYDVTTDSCMLDLDDFLDDNLNYSSHPCLAKGVHVLAVSHTVRRHDNLLMLIGLL